jgi:hypothetical protein
MFWLRNTGNYVKMKLGLERVVVESLSGSWRV